MSYQPRDDRGYPWVAGWNSRDLYGLTAHGPQNWANAFLNRTRSGGKGGTAESFQWWVSQRGLGLEAQIRLSRRGWGGLPRVPKRCGFPDKPCTCRRDVEIREEPAA